MKAVSRVLIFLFSFSVYPGDFGTLADNTWTRIADCPGDAIGRDVPPGRGSTWAYEPSTGKFLRYGGYTPSFSNVLDAFDPTAKTWTRLTAYDETYPSDRPGGGSSWMVAYDSARSVIWLAGGKATTAAGDLGVWRYDPSAGSFTRAGNALSYTARYAYDWKNSVIVASPGRTCYGAPAGRTDVFNTATGQWESRQTDTLPQACYAGNYPCVYDPSISRVVLLAGSETWHYDAAANRWENVTVTGTPPSAGMPALAYDPENEVVIRYGGSDGRNHGSYMNETWIYKGSTRTWTQLNCPGIPVHAQSRGNQPIFYHQAFDFYPAGHCAVLCDPDLGVWALKYNPASPAGTAAVDADSVVVGKAAQNPAAPGPADVLRSFPSALNPRFVNLGDDTLISLGGGSFSGDEISWDYDPDLGLIVKYGGCGNGSNPYWAGYGSSMGVYDPGTETWFTRRVSDASGMNRPGSGCTRSTIYDTNRRKWWFFGDVSGEPYPCYPPGKIGPYSYDFSTDLFTDHKVVTDNPSSTNMAYDPVHDITIKPDSGRIHIFEFDSLKWRQVPVSGGPGRIDGYASTEWVPTLNAFLTFRRGKTWAYYPDSGKWVDLNPANPPPARECKMGFAYDSHNDIVLLAGGYLTWNENPVKDMWAYHPSTNSWEALNPAPAPSWFSAHYAGLQQTAYDSRHNVFFIQYESWNALYAYRYKVADLAGEKGPRAAAADPLNISPNPFNAAVTFSAHGEIGSLRIFDVRGRMVADLTGSLKDNRVQWNSGNLGPGVYFAVLKTDRRAVSRKCLLVK